MSDNSNGPKKEEAYEAEETRGEKYDPRQYPQDTREEESSYRVVESKKKYKVENWIFPALSPFAFLLLGFAFGWWAWGWIIIPVCAIIGTPMKFWMKIVSLSPFLYLILGFAFGWWAWAWIMIPVSAILSQGIRRKA